MRKICLGFFLLIFTVFLGIGFMPSPNAQAAMEKGGTVYLNFGGSQPGGSWYIIAGGLSAYFTKEIKGLNVVAESTQGDVALASMIAKRNIDLIPTHSVTMAADYRGIGIFKGRKPARNVRVLSKLYSAPCTIVTLRNSPINSIMDLRGKTLAGGPMGSGSVKNLLKILDTFGLRKSVKIKYYTYGDEPDALIEGHIDAFLQNSAPIGNVLEVEAKRGIKIIPFTKAEIKKFTEVNKGFWGGELKAGTYKTIQKPILTIWDTVFWVADESVPENAVYKMLKLIFSPAGRKEAVKIHKNLSQMSDGIQEDLASMQVPYHPGAVKYWEEQGKTIPPALMPPK